MHASNRRFVATRPTFAELWANPLELRQAGGYAHTLAEIWQQPEMWTDAARRAASLRGSIDSAKAIVLTGSGSSFYVGKCIANSLQESTRLPVTALESGEILMLGAGVLPPERPLLVVSFARSGDSPESWGLVQHLLDEEPGISHLLITCNPNGRLARRWGAGGPGSGSSVPDPRVNVLLLDERCCDRSLVMTSSFTSMVVAGMALANPERYLETVEALAASVSHFLGNELAPIEESPIEKIHRMIAVGSGVLQGAALESALKMLEMSDGRVLTRSETCLGLRHGPMCALDKRSLLFVPLSSHPLRRAYQMDLLKEVDQKRLGCWKIVIGGSVPSEIIQSGDLAIELPVLRELGDEWLAVAAVVAGQLLAFLRCRDEGLRPDAPAVSDSISRVVGEFKLHNLSAEVG